MEIKAISPMLTEIRIQYGEPAKFLLTSDYHYDNPKCLRDKLHKNLDEALASNAKVFCFGDILCLMQGKYDPRGSKKDIRPEHNTHNYIDVVIEDTASKLAKYPFAVISQGNHESAPSKRLETDILGRLVDTINLQKQPSEKVIRGGYHGFVRIIFHNNGGNVKTYHLYFHHGLWGGSVMKGMQGNPRFASIVDADFVVSGHVHVRNMDESMRYSIDKAGILRTKPQYFLKCGTYKEEFLEPHGFAIEKIVMPKNIGGWWLEFEGTRNTDLQVKIQMTS
jgi:predicted phosphodiesterase